MNDCPYVGLVPFEKDHAPYFFGRGEDISRIIANLSAHRLTLLYGPSGVGKSSVLNAGVIAAIDRENEMVRARGDVPDWQVVVFRGWQSSPVAGLLRVLDEALSAAGHHASAPGSSAAAERSQPPSDSKRVSLIHERLLDYFFIDAGGKCVNERENLPDLLIILDQFEEFFLYHGASDEGRAFIEQMATVITDRRLRAGFMISMREDSLAKLDVFKSRIPFLFNNCLRLGPLTAEGARDAITKPLEVFNETHGLRDAAAWSVAETLVNETINEVRDGKVMLGDAPVGDAPILDQKARSKDAAVDAACLQMVMSRLWTVESAQGSTTIRSETFDKLGRSKGIIGRHLDTILNGGEFSAGDRKLTAEISRHLVTSSNSKVAHSTQALAELTSMDRGKIQAVLDKLASPGARVLRTVQTLQPGEDVRYEVFHDLLGRAIIDWRRKFFSEEQARRDRIKTVRWLILTACGVVSFIALAVFAGRLNTWKNEAVAAKDLKEKAEEAARLAEGSAAEQANKSSVLLKEAYTMERKLTSAVESSSAALKHVAEIVGEVDANAPAEKRARQMEQAIAKLREAVGANLPPPPEPKAAGPKFIPLSGHGGSVWQARFSSNGRLLATACEDGLVRVWRVRNEEGELQSKGVMLPGFPVTAMTTPDKTGAWRIGFDSGNFLAAAPMSGPVLIYHFNEEETPAARFATVPMQGDLSDLELYRARDTGRFSFVTVTGEKLIRAWSLDTRAAPGGTVSKPVYESTQATLVSSIGFSPDGKYAVTSAHSSDDSRAQNLVVLDLASNPARPAVIYSQALGAPTRRVVFSPKGSLIAGGMGKQVLIADYRKPSEKPALLSGHEAAVWEVAFSPDGKTLASVAPDGRCLLWDAMTRKQKAEVSTSVRGRIFSVAWSSGNVLALGGEDGWVAMWRMTADGRPDGDAHAFPGHLGPVWGVLFSRDGQQLASWTRTLGGAGDYTPKGRAIVSQGTINLKADGTAVVWDVEASLAKPPAGKSAN